MSPALGVSAAANLTGLFRGLGVPFAHARAHKGHGVAQNARVGALLNRLRRQMPPPRAGPRPPVEQPKQMPRHGASSQLAQTASAVYDWRAADLLGSSMRTFAIGVEPPKC